MSNRDEYVSKMKSQLDEWNAEVARWDAKVKAAEADMKVEYERQLAAVRAQRDQAIGTLAKLQGASADAWMDMVRGADEAWKRMSDAVQQARDRFDGKK